MEHVHVQAYCSDSEGYFEMDLTSAHFHSGTLGDASSLHGVCLFTSLSFTIIIIVVVIIID